VPNKFLLLSLHVSRNCLLIYLVVQLERHHPDDRLLRPVAEKFQEFLHLLYQRDCEVLNSTFPWFCNQVKIKEIHRFSRVTFYNSQINISAKLEFERPQRHHPDDWPGGSGTGCRCVPATACTCFGKMLVRLYACRGTACSWCSKAES